MGVPIIQMGPKQRTGAAYAQPVAEGLAGLIQGYRKKKEGKALAELLGLDEEQTERFQSLSPDLQKTYGSIIQTGRKEKAKALESSSKSTASYLKEYHPSLYESPSAKRDIEKRAREMIESGQTFSPAEAARMAVGERLAEKEESDTPKETIFGEMRTPKKSLIEMATEPEEGKQPGWIRALTKPSELSAGEFSGSIGLGTLSPIEQGLDLLRNAGFNVAEKMGLLPERKKMPLVTDKLRERLYKGMSPSQIEEASALEVVGAVIPIERLVGSMVGLGKSAKFFKNAERVAEAKGISTAEAVKSIAQDAEKVGIDLAKVSEGDAKESAKMFNLSNRVSKEAPKTSTEARVARAKPAEKIFKTEKEIATRESQLKAFPKYEEEIAADAADRAARAEARVPKTERGLAGRAARIQHAEKNLPAAEEGYRKSIARVRALENEVAQLPEAERVRASALLEMAKQDLKDSEFALKQTMKNAERGEARAGLKEMRDAARSKMLDISEKISEGNPVQLGKADFNPEMVKEANRINKKKPLSAKKQSDFHTDVGDAYLGEYRNQLDKVNKELKQTPKTMAEAQKLQNLKKEKEVLTKLIDHLEAKNAIHRHKLALRETAERHKASQRFKELKKTEGKPKVQKVAKQKIEEAIKNPSGKAAEEVAEKAGVKPSDLGDITKESKSMWDRLASTKTKKMSALNREFNKFRSVMKEKGITDAFLKTPFGQEVGLTMLQIGLDEAYGKHVPYVGSIANPIIGRRVGMAGLRSAFLGLYRKARNETMKQGYLNAIKRGDDEKVTEFKRKHPQLASQARKRLR